MDEYSYRQSSGDIAEDTICELFTMDFYLHQLMDRTAAPGGDEWVKCCLSLSPPSLMVENVDVAVPPALLSLPALAPPPVPVQFLP